MNASNLFDSMLAVSFYSMFELLAFLAFCNFFSYQGQ